MATTNTPSAAFISGQPLTTEIVDTQAPGLLTDTVDQRIIRIRPMATPLDQITRCAQSRSTQSMKVQYYSIDTKAVDTTTAAAADLDDFDTTGEDGQKRGLITLTEPRIFEASDTAFFPTLRDSASNPLVAYVEKRTDNAIQVILINPGTDITSIPAGTPIIRMARAATETDVQSPQFAATPKKNNNQCQIFKMQVEQTTFVKMAAKEVGWSFSDQEEVAVIDMRQAMEKSFLFGQKAIVHDTEKGEEVYLTGGIWGQTDAAVDYDRDNLRINDLDAICSLAFTGESAGSRRKILLAGTGLMEALARIDYNKSIAARDTVVKWGIEFREIVSNYGTLYVVHSETFDKCGHRNDGFIIDPDYITKYVHIPFHTDRLDLRTSGQRNTDAVVITEASCLVLRHPKAHVKILAKTA